MKKKIIIPICVVVTLLIIGTIISIIKFSTFNPISSLYGIMKISISDTEYAVIQNKPSKVIISKPNNNDRSAQFMFEEYMSERGFKITDQYGSHYTFSNGVEIEKVHFSVNGYYSLWKWDW